MDASSRAEAFSENSSHLASNPSSHSYRWVRAPRSQTVRRKRWSWDRDAAHAEALQDRLRARAPIILGRYLRKTLERWLPLPPVRRQDLSVQSCPLAGQGRCCFSECAWSSCSASLWLRPGITSKWLKRLELA